MALVLAIEDELYMDKLYRETLGKGRFEVIVKDRWEEAQKILSSKKIDLLLLDIGLPDLDGIEILKQVRRLFSSLPVIMVTAYGTDERIQQAKELGIVDFIIKPFKIPVLREKIQKVLGLK